MFYHFSTKSLGQFAVKKQHSCSVYLLNRLVLNICILLKLYDYNSMELWNLNWLHKQQSEAANIVFLKIFVLVYVPAVFPCEYREPFKRQPHEMVKHSSNSSAICRRIVWVCLTILRGWRLKGQYSECFQSKNTRTT